MNTQTSIRSIAIPQLHISQFFRPIIAILVLLALFITGNLASAQETDECVVTAESNDSVRVRVGPGEHRTSVTFLATDTEYTVLGRYEADDDEIWFQLDKDEAAPNRAINEAWINASEVETHGDCDTLEDTSAPPIIPIVNHAATTTESNDAENGETTVAEDGHIILSEGMWHVNYADITNASCETVDNIEFTTLEWFGFQPGFTDELILTETGFTHGGVDFTYIGDNTYHGSFSDGLLTGTVYLTATAPNIMVGRYIDSMNGCSATTNITLTLQ